MQDGWQEHSHSPETAYYLQEPAVPVPARRDSLPARLAAFCF